MPVLLALDALPGTSVTQGVAKRSLDATEFRSRMEMPLEPGVAQDLRGVLVHERVDLTDARIGNVDLTGACFKAPLIASRSVWCGVAWFKECVFEGGVDFGASEFANDARFDRSVFHANAVFSRAQVSGQLVFDCAIFEGPAFLDKLELLANLSLGGTIFRDIASFEESECMGGLWSDSTRFESRTNARGMEVHGRLWLVGAAATNSAFRQITSYGYRWS